MDEWLAGWLQAILRQQKGKVEQGRWWKRKEKLKVGDTDWKKRKTWLRGRVGTVKRERDTVKSI